MQVAAHCFLAGIMEMHLEWGTKQTGCNLFQNINLPEIILIGRWTPTLVQGELLSLSIIGMDGGQVHSLFLVSSGRVFSAGGNFNAPGALGLGDTSSRFG